MMPISPESRKRLLKQTPIIVRAETDEHTPTSLTRVLVRVPLHTVSAGATAGRRKSLPGKRQCHSFLTPFAFPADGRIQYLVWSPPTPRRWNP